MGELDQYSAKPSSIGLQACASSRTAHGGVTGNADHEDEVSLSFAHHHYVESVIKRYTVASSFNCSAGSSPQSLTATTDGQASMSTLGQR